jgi:hypothetical protein
MGWSFNYMPLTLFWRNQPAIKLFSSAVAGEEVEDFCEGSFSHTGEFFAHTSFTLLFVLFCFTLFILLASFYQKPKKK